MTDQNLQDVELLENEAGGECRSLKGFVVAIETYRRKNIGTFLRCCVAFGAKAVVVVGSEKYSTHGAHGAQKYMEIIHIYSWTEFRECMGLMGIEIYGVLTSESLNSIPIEKYGSFNQSAAFIIGDKGGLNDHQLAVCDRFLHVEFPLSTLPSNFQISYEAIASICFSQFCVCMNMEEQTPKSEKFPVKSEENDGMKDNFVHEIRMAVEQQLHQKYLTQSDEEDFQINIFEEADTIYEDTSLCMSLIPCSSICDQV